MLLCPKCGNQIIKVRCDNQDFEEYRCLNGHFWGYSDRIGQEPMDKKRWKWARKDLK
jgi:hypothetical protein